MFTLENDRLSLRMAEDYSAVSLCDRRRGTIWELDAPGLAFRREDAGPAEPLRGGRVTREGDSLLVTFTLPEGVIQYRWRLASSHVEIELSAATPAIECLPLPGLMLPKGEEYELALPLYQGVLIRRDPGTWQVRAASGGHGAFGMAMGGVLTERSGLLVTEGRPADWKGVYGSDGGRLFFCFEQLRCPVEGWGPHRVRLYPTDPSLTALCKQYREYCREQGGLVTWEEKIARKPILEQLFGALIAFTGYNRAPGMDYAAEVRRLKAHGFDTLLLFPVRMCHHSLDFKMGGDEPVWLTDDEIAAIRAVPGALVAPWAWLFEALDDGSAERRALYRLDRSGNPIPHWRIDEYQWYLACTPYQGEHYRRRLESDMHATDWVHFDVNANYAPTPCFSEDHALHGGRPLTRGGDVQSVRDLLSPETVGNRIVSSEGFVGHYTPQYDIGTAKMMPGPNLATKTPVPMTMLVFHDCCVHDWWEFQNYNALEGWPVREAHQGIGLIGSGLPAVKAAVDALYGCPPNICPFGRQYAWRDFENRESFSYSVHLDDPAVQEAIRAALPVAALHGEIGRCEMTEFRFLSEDRSLQLTRFSDGTEIVANFSEEAREVEGYGEVPGVSWRRG